MVGRWLSKAEREARDRKIIELYQQGVSARNLRLRFGWGLNVSEILRKHGIEAYQRAERIYSRVKPCIE